ncbi:serine-type D-Ala-D-Ala carboxypeptidase/endopeptidase (penicillin-binding protein 4) [Phycisphaerales bacterium]|nr:serine-type D-Ala-D-Ala carboxypeptidase/endopeptidase (penicillin-binding protein 4) [Phycisphaerales bacterium]
MVNAWRRFAGCAVLTACGVAALAQPGALNEDVSRAIGKRKLGEARVGISVRDADNGVVLADFRGSEPLTPASNMKLLTSGAALLVLTPEFAFRTEVILDGDRLIVRGAGDPALADPELLSRMSPKLTVGDVLTVVTGAVVKAGVTGVREIIVDDRVFDRQFVHPSWPTEKLDRGYSAEVAGLNFHANVIEVFPRPSQDGAGSPPLFSIQPEAPWLRIDNRARTVLDGKNTVWLSRDPQANRFVLRGEVRNASQVGVEVTVHNPPEFFGQLLADQLSRAGVRIAGGASSTEGGPRGVRVAQDGEILTGGRVLAAVSTPISEALHRCNSDSANLYAECFLKRIGQAVTKEPGSWSNGGAVLRMVLSQRLGAQVGAGVTIADGSGLSRDNAVAPGTLARWLEVVAKESAARDTFTNSLAKPGEGTLKKRFGGVKLKNDLYAKSGFINGVRTLSGYLVDPESGRRIAFSVMVNDIKTDVQTAAALDLHEEVVKIADEWLAKKTTGTKQGG